MLTMRRVVPLICVGLLFGCDDGSKVEPTAASSASPYKTATRCGSAASGSGSTDAP